MSYTHVNNPGGQPGPAVGGFASDAQVAGQPMPHAGYFQPVVVMNSPGRQGPAITSLVLGIVAAVFCLIPIVGMLSLILAPIGLVFGGIAWRGAAKGRRAGKGKAIAGVALAIVAFIGAVASTVAVASAVDEAGKSIDRAVGNATDEVLANDLAVTIGSYSAKDLGFGLSDGSLTVTLTNKSDERQSFDIKVEALSASGSRIATDTAFVSDLGAGQSDDVAMFEFESGKDAEQLKTATFRVIEASAY